MSRYEPPIFDPSENRDRPAHDVIWERAQGMKLPKGWVVHHADGNGHNNNPGNLIALPRSEHVKLHAAMRRQGVDPVNPNDVDVMHARESSKKSHHRNYARECVYQKKWIAEHKDLVAASDRRKYVKHRDKILEARKNYYSENRDVICARIKRYRDENPDVIRARKKTYYESHREEIIAKNNAYHLKHADEYAAYKRQYAEAHRAVANANSKLHYLIKHGATQEQIDVARAVLESEKQKCGVGKYRRKEV